MTEKSTTQNLTTWLTDEFNAPGWHSAVVAQELSEDLLDSIAARFDEFNKATKIGILFAILHIRKGEMASKMNQVTKIIGIASQDQDEWVRLLGHTIQDVPTLKQLNLNSNEWASQAQPTLDHVVKTIQEKGFGFHPIEFAVVQKSAQPVCKYNNASYESNEPTIVKHFQLDTSNQNIISDTERANRFEALMRAEDDTLESPLTSPTSYSHASNRFPGDNQMNSSGNINNGSNVSTSAGIGRPPPPSSLYARGSMDGRTGLRPPPPRPRPNAAASSSLFIQRPMSRKPSLGADGNKPSFLRPSGPARFSRPLPPGVATNASGGAPPLYGPGSGTPSRPMARNESSIPKGFIKQSRVQMLDFTDASELQESNTRAIDTAMQDLQNEKEARKLQLAEDRRLAAEKRKLAAQKEKEEREATKRRKQSKSDISSTVGNGDMSEGAQTTTSTEQSQSSPVSSPKQETQPMMESPPQPMEPNASFSQFYIKPGNEYLPPQN